MKKKLLVLFFALVLALSLFSLMVGAANEISEIGIENLRSPMAGSCPDYAADLIRTDLQFVEMPEKGSVNGIVWYEMQYVSGYQEAKLVRLKKLTVLKLINPILCRFMYVPIPTMLFFLTEQQQVFTSWPAILRVCHQRQLP